MLDDLNVIASIISGFLGAAFAAATLIFRGKADFNKMVDGRIQMILDNNSETITAQGIRIDDLKKEIQQEREDCDRKLDEQDRKHNIQISALREEINILRRRLNIISDPELVE